MARKLGVSQAEIIRYLSGQNMGIVEGSNVKLEEQHIRQLYSHFAPAENFETKTSKEDEVVAPATAQVIAPDVPKGEFAEKALGTDILVPHEGNTISSGADFVQAEPSTSGSAGDAASNLETATPVDAEAVEIIRASKIELAGLKVIGKIDLPEPKKKEVALPDESVATAAAEGDEVADPVQKPIAERREDDDRSKEKPRRDDGRNQDERRRARTTQSREQRPRKNPIAAQREREIEAERERRMEKAAQDKERRTQNYHKRVQHSPPTKAVRMFEEPLEQLNASSFTEEPTTWFGKFVKWLRG
jgi:hypothetical protein